MIEKEKIKKLIDGIEECHYIDTSKSNEDYELIIEILKKSIEE